MLEHIGIKAKADGFLRCGLSRPTGPDKLVALPNLRALEPRAIELWRIVRINPFALRSTLLRRHGHTPVPLRIILTKMRVREANCHA